MKRGHRGWRFGYKPVVISLTHANEESSTVRVRCALPVSPSILLFTAPQGWVMRRLASSYQHTVLITICPESCACVPSAQFPQPVGSAERACDEES